MPNGRLLVLTKNNVAKQDLVLVTPKISCQQTFEEELKNGFTSSVKKS
jgi:hypothetical protein